MTAAQFFLGTPFFISLFLLSVLVWIVRKCDEKYLKLFFIWKLCEMIYLFLFWLGLGHWKLCSSQLTIYFNRLHVLPFYKSTQLWTCLVIFSGNLFVSRGNMRNWMFSIDWERTNEFRLVRAYGLRQPICVIWLGLASDK